MRVISFQTVWEKVRESIKVDWHIANANQLIKDLDFSSYFCRIVPKMATIRLSEKRIHAIMEQCESLNDLYDVSTADVYFQCNDDDTKLVPAHKCLLASDSPKFREIFFEGSQTQQILMLDITLDTFTTFLQSFYCEVFTIKRENLFELTHLAEKYDAKKCKSACWEFVDQTIQTASEDIFQALELVITFNRVDLRNRCLAKLMVDGHFLIDTESFVSCSRQVFNIVLGLDFIGRNELKMFNASIQWAKHRCTMEKLDPEHPLNLRLVLVDSFSQIKFHKMSAQQFIQCLSLHAGVFTTAELKNVAKSIEKPKQSTDKSNTRGNSRQLIVVTAINANHRPYEAIESMLGDAKTANVLFVFGTTAIEQKIIYAHKCVLAARSRVFKQSFYTGNASSDQYPISNANHEEFYTFIGTFYRKSADGLLTMENIPKLIELASSYEVTGLLDKCIDFAIERLCSRNIFHILDLCFIHSNADSVSLCLDWIIAHDDDMNRAFHSMSLVHCSQKTVEFCLGLNFPDRDEMRVFKASIEWAKKLCQYNQMEPTSDNLKMTLGEAFELIRFSSMQPVDFFELTLNFKGMFSHAEIENINQITIKKLAADNEDLGQLMTSFK